MDVATSVTCPTAPVPMGGDGPTRPCPLCGARAAEELHTARYALFDDSALPTATTIVRCDDCGATYADSHATAADYRSHYARHSKYDTIAAASGSGCTPADASRLSAQVDRLAPHVAFSAAILDVGTGQGGLLRAFIERGFTDVTGIDPAPGCVATMRRAGFRAELGELEAVDWPTDPRRFDLVTLSHVFEHVFDLRTAFERIAARVVPTGRIYVEVPDAARYTLDGFPPFYFLDPEHINHFDLAALTAFAARSGWRVEQSWREAIVLGSGVRYPIVAVLLVRGSEALASSAARSTRIAFQDYLDASRSAMGRSPSTAVIANWATSRRSLVLWGAGSHAQRLLAQSALGTCRVDCVIDGDVGKQGRLLAGLPVVDAAAGLARARALHAEVAIAIAVGAADVVARLAATHPDLVVRVL